MMALNTIVLVYVSFLCNGHNEKYISKSLVFDPFCPQYDVMSMLTFRNCYVFFTLLLRYCFRYINVHIIRYTVS